MNSDEIRLLIEQGISDCQATVDGDGRHFQAVLVSDAFAGLGPVKRHQLVYRALGNKMESEIHALSIQAFTPVEWEQQRGLKVL